MKTFRIVQDYDSFGNTRYHVQKRYWWFPIWHYMLGSYSSSLETCRKIIINKNRKSRVVE